MVQVLVKPANWSLASISEISFSQVIPGRHWSRGLSMTVVSYMSRGILSVALSKLAVRAVF